MTSLSQIAISRGAFAACLSLLLLSLRGHEAAAEGSAEIGLSQGLSLSTELFVDVLDPEVERIRWTGLGDVLVRAPDGTSLDQFTPGEDGSVTIDLAGVGQVGAYELQLFEHQYNDDDPSNIIPLAWDIAILDPVAVGGRLFSLSWSFNSGGFGTDRSTSASFFAVVPGGPAGATAVIDLDLEGLAGWVYRVTGNRTGIDGATASLSVPEGSATVTPELPLYLNPPTVATYSYIEPDIVAFRFSGGPAGCNIIAPGTTTGEFQLETNVDGTYQIQCDLDGDGFGPDDSDDLFFLGTTIPGMTTVLWDGNDGAGDPVPLGTYACRARVNVGEFHYVGRDIETSFPGMRFYEVDAGGGRTPLRIRWNDRLSTLR